MSAQEKDDIEIEDEFEFEIEDDTPEADRGRDKASDESDDDDEIEDEELRNFSQGAQKRIKTLTKKRHDERRAKEDKERQLTEAVNAIRTVTAENEKLRKSLSGAATSAVGATKSQVEAELTGLKKDLAEAIELGDGTKVADLQEKLADAKWRLNGAVHAEGRLKQAEEDDKNKPATPTVQSPDDWPKARKNWAKQNADWFNKDPEMTALAYGLHQKLIEKDKLVPDSEEYFEAIDKGMRKRFPEAFEDDEEEDEPKPGKRRAEPRTAGTPGGGGGGGKGGKKTYKLSRSQYALCERLGITPHQYVKELAAKEKNNV